MSETRVIVAIDFGTTYSGFGCAHKHNPKHITVYSNYEGYNGRFKTFTVLKYDESLKLMSWGYPALAEKPNRRRKTPDIKPVERFKLYLGKMENKLYLPEGINFETAITDYLQKMGEVIKETVKTTWQNVDYFRQVKIIMTIPAEFDGKAMKIMRKCAYDAGIINEEDSKNLDFTTEPEAAAIYCMKKKEYHISVGSSFMVVDCGGGTVDLTTRKLLANDELDEITEREGDFCGGSFVDDEFLKFISNKVGESAFDIVKKNHYSQLQYMVQAFCRRVKTQFTGQESTFPHEFDLANICPILKQYVKGEKLDEMEDIEWIVELTFDDVKSMFDPVIKRIISLIHKQLDKSRTNGHDICAMFLVGGFSESKYLQTRIKEEFRNDVPNISVPIQPVTAVVRGAVQFGLNQDIVKTRVLKWTYGTDVAKKWVQGDPTNRRRKDGRIIKFSRLAKRGDKVAANEKIVRTYHPPNTTQKQLGLDIYVTKKEDATYCDESGVELLDRWCVDVPKATKEDRAFEITLTFGKIEIEAMAQTKNGERYQTTFDLDI